MTNEHLHSRRNILRLETLRGAVNVFTTFVSKDKIVPRVLLLVSERTSIPLWGDNREESQISVFRYWVFVLIGSFAQ